MNRSILGIIVAAITAAASPALAQDAPKAGKTGPSAGAGQSDGGSATLSKKGYDSWKAHSDMGIAAPARAPAGVAHEYHRTTGPCANAGGDTDCGGKAEEGGSAPPTR